MDWVFVFILAGDVVYVLEFYSLNGTSIMESVVLRSGALFKCKCIQSSLVHLHSGGSVCEALTMS